MPQGAGALIAFGIREPPHPRKVASQPLPSFNPIHLSPTMRRYLITLVLFTLARATETFIHLANRFGRRPVLLTGWLAYGVNVHPHADEAAPR